MTTIGDLVQPVAAVLGGRDDIGTASLAWIRDAVLEITCSWPFENLRETGPQRQLTQGIYNYPLASFLNGEVDASQIPSFIVFLDPPNNTVVKRLTFKTIQEIEQRLYVQGPPVQFTRFGGNIFFAPVPNNTYTVFMRYQRYHEFDNENLAQTILRVPDDWLEIVKYAAALRGAMEIRGAKEYIPGLRTLLYGDPEASMPSVKSGRPGIIAARLMQQERDTAYDTTQLSLVADRY